MAGRGASGPVLRAFCGSDGALRRSAGWRMIEPPQPPASGAISSRSSPPSRRRRGCRRRSGTRRRPSASGSRRASARRCRCAPHVAAVKGEASAVVIPRLTETDAGPTGRPCPRLRRGRGGGPPPLCRAPARPDLHHAGAPGLSQLRPPDRSPRPGIEPDPRPFPAIRRGAAAPTGPAAWPTGRARCRARWPPGRDHLHRHQHPGTGRARRPAAAACLPHRSRSRQGCDGPGRGLPLPLLTHAGARARRRRGGPRQRRAGAPCPRGDDRRLSAAAAHRGGSRRTATLSGGRRGAAACPSAARGSG